MRPRPPAKAPDRARKVDADLAALTRMVRRYCAEVHQAAGDTPCDSCRGLVAYAGRRLAHCPMDPKPKCKDCPEHCYSPRRRDQVRAVMRQTALRSTSERMGL